MKIIRSRETLLLLNIFIYNLRNRLSHFHRYIFTDIKFSFNLLVRFNYIINYVPNDCDSLSIDIDEIATRGQESETEMEGEGDKEKSQRKRRTQKRERARRNDSVATDRVDDTIASRMKRRRKQLQDDDDDENNQK